MAFDKCTCDYGWTGVSCALPDCEAVNQCSNKGECISSDKCRCLPGFIGADCGQMADCSHLANCSGQGVCVSTEMLNVLCSCYLGFTGDNCSQPTCTTVNNCSAHGACVEAEFCKCDFGYIGTDCSNFSCEAVNYCSGKCVVLKFLLWTHHTSEENILFVSKNDISFAFHVPRKMVTESFNVFEWSAATRTHNSVFMIMNLTFSPTTFISCLLCSCSF